MLFIDYMVNYLFKWLEMNMLKALNGSQRKQLYCLTSCDFMRKKSKVRETTRPAIFSNEDG